MQMSGEVSSGLDVGALHQHTGDDLQAVGDPMLNLLQQDIPFVQQIVLTRLGEAGVARSPATVISRRVPPASP